MKKQELSLYLINNMEPKRWKLWLASIHNGTAHTDQAVVSSVKRPQRYCLL